MATTPYPQLSGVPVANVEPEYNDAGTLPLTFRLLLVDSAGDPFDAETEGYTFELVAGRGSTRYAEETGSPTVGTTDFSLSASVNTAAKSAVFYQVRGIKSGSPTSVWVQGTWDAKLVLADGTPGSDTAPRIDVQVTVTSGSPVSASSYLVRGPEGASSTIDDGSLTNAKLADMATATIKGRATAGTGAPEDLTATQARTLLSIENVDNTADADKPVSTAQAAADALKLSIASNLSDLNDVATAQDNLALVPGTDVQPLHPNLTTYAAKTPPSGAVLGDTDTQTYTNKTADYTVNFFTNFPHYHQEGFGAASTDLTVGTDKILFFAPFDMVLDGCHVDLEGTAPTGSGITFDVNALGTSIATTAPTIDENETSTRTAATPAVLSSATILEGTPITIDVDSVGSTTAGQGRARVTLQYHEVFIPAGSPTVSFSYTGSGSPTVGDFAYINILFSVEVTDLVLAGVATTGYTSPAIFSIGASKRQACFYGVVAEGDNTLSVNAGAVQSLEGSLDNVASAVHTVTAVAAAGGGVDNGAWDPFNEHTAPTDSSWGGDGRNRYEITGATGAIIDPDVSNPYTPLPTLRITPTASTFAGWRIFLDEMGWDPASVATTFRFKFKAPDATNYGIALRFRDSGGGALVPNVSSTNVTADGTTQEVDYDLATGDVPVGTHSIIFYVRPVTNTSTAFDIYYHDVRKTSEYTTASGAVVAQHDDRGHDVTGYPGGSLAGGATQGSCADPYPPYDSGNRTTTFLTTGQSLGTGADSNPTVNTSGVSADIQMWNEYNESGADPRFTALVTATGNVTRGIVQMATSGETTTADRAREVLDYSAAVTYRALRIAAALGGECIVLNGARGGSNTQVWSTPTDPELVDCILQISETQAEVADGINLSNVFHIQGYGEHNKTLATHTSRLITFVDYITSEGKSTTGQPDLPTVLISQVGNWGMAGYTTSPQPIAERNVALETSGAGGRKGVAFLLGPEYPYTYDGGGPHMDADGYQHLGHILGKARFDLEQNGDWLPVHVLSATSDPDSTGNDHLIELAVHVPYGPLVLDTGRVPDPGDSGIEYFDSLNDSVTTGTVIDSVTLTDGGGAVEGATALIRVTLDAGITIGTSRQIGIGYTSRDGTGSGYIGTAGPRTPWRDSDSRTSPLTGAYEGYNWMIHDLLDVS